MRAEAAGPDLPRRHPDQQELRQGRMPWFDRTECNDLEFQGIFMTRKSVNGWRRWAAAPIAVLVVVALMASFLPLIETNIWWIRYADFFRLQMAIALIILLPAFLALRGRVGKAGWALSVLTVVALGYHVSKLYPYSPFPGRVAAGVEACSPDQTLTVMVANVQMRNEQASDLLRLVSEVEPDVLLVMETDAWWDRHLEPLSDSYPERVQFIPEDHGAFGMHLLSKLKLVSPEFRFWFDAYTPTIETGLRLRSGETVQFLGLHPHPPLAPSQPTTLRDGHLLNAAFEARASEAPTVVAGDFNAVPWERVTRRAARIGGLLDPRIGRGYYPSFRAGNPVISWPLDHILYQEGFGLLEFDMLPGVGSDHFPVVASLCHGPPGSFAQHAPEPEAGDLREAQDAIAAARALKPES